MQHNGLQPQLPQYTIYVLSHLVEAQKKVFTKQKETNINKTRCNKNNKNIFHIGVVIIPEVLRN